jgi:hypothetical protein
LRLQRLFNFFREHLRKFLYFRTISYILQYRFINELRLVALVWGSIISELLPQLIQGIVGSVIALVDVYDLTSIPNCFSRSSNLRMLQAQ